MIHWPDLTFPPINLWTAPARMNSVEAVQSVPSPCVRLCKIDPSTGLCIGCKRTLEEIKEWIVYSDEEKLRVLEKIRKNRKTQQ